MATVDGLTKTRMLAIEAASVVSGSVDSGTGHLILTTHDGTTIDAGYVWGTVVSATSTVQGIVELATDTETATGTDTTRAVTPANLASVLTGKQASDSDLTAIAALTPTNDDVLQRKTGAWVNRSMAQIKTDLVLVKGDVGLGSVDNTADTAKPVSTAQATSIATKTDKSTLTTKGDLYVATAASTPARLGVGTNGQVLTADSTQSTGAKWATPAASSGGGSWWTRARSGIWYPLTGYGTVGGTSATALVSNSEYAIPMIFGFSANITGLAINKGNTTGNIRLGVRDDAGDLSPGAVLYDSGALGTASGVIAVSSLTGIPMTKGVPIWFTVASQGGGGTVTMESITHPFVGSVSSSTPSATDFTTNQPAMYSQTGVSGALPGTFTIATSAMTSIGVIIMKVQFGSITQGP